MLKDLWDKFDKNALWEAVKLPLRLFVLSLVGFIVDYLIQYFGGVNSQLGVLISLILVMIDKYLHEVRSASTKKPLEGFDRGLVPF